MTYRFLCRMLVVAGIMLAAVIFVAYWYGGGDCGLRILSGKNCILCGCTRDFIGVLNLDFTFINPLSPYIFAMLFCEFAFRCLGSLVLFPMWAWIVDASFHCVVLVAFVVVNFVVMFC